MTGFDPRGVLTDARKQKAWWDRISAIDRLATQTWWETLPQTLAELVNRWGLSEVRVHPALSYGLILRVRQSDRDGVLKLYPPAIAAEREITWYQLQTSGLGPEIWATAGDERALLMEEIQPGDSLESVADDERATQMLAQVLRDLMEARFQGPIPESTFPSVSSFAESLTILRGKISPPHIQRAQEILKRPGSSLLHGDLHHGNVLLASRDSLRVIDPKGLIGPFAYEVAAMFRNPAGRDLNAKLLRRRMDILSDVMTLSRSELQDFGMAGTLLAAAWSLEDGASDVTRELAIAGVLTTL